MISGARYHRVATYSVIKPWFAAFLAVPWPFPAGLYPRASPKSQILSSQSAFTSKLPGLRSRWSTFAEWMYFSPQSVW